MSEPQPNDSSSLEVDREIDRICEEFENALRDGKQPELGRFAERISETVRPKLRAKLQSIELERCQSDEARNQSSIARCPSCSAPFDVSTCESLSDATCPVCGSVFARSSDATTVSFHDPGARTLGHFELIERVGSGQFGDVWKAKDTQLDRTVAVKIPRKNDLTDEEGELFFREARAAAQLKHSNIVRVHEVGRVDGTIYIVSDFITGATLKEWIAEKPTGNRQAAELAFTIAQALHHAHQAGVIHRDLKPGNIMMDGEGSPHVMDFGLAKREAGEATMTIEGRVMGTPAYMPPEQASGASHQVGPPADVYALGVVLFELLTGELPFRGGKQMILLQILNDEPPSPRKFESSVPRDLETICLKCLEKDPGGRYQSAGALAADLKRWMNSEPILARRIGRVGRAIRWCRRRPAIAALSGLIVLLIVVGSIGVIWQRNRAQEQETRTAAALKLVDELIARRDRYNNVHGANKLLDASGIQPVQKKQLQEALKHYRDLIQKKGKDAAARAELASAFRRVAYITGRIGSKEDALRAYRRAAGFLAGLVREQPENPKWKWMLGRSNNDLGVIHLELSHHDDSLRWFERAIGVREALTRDHPARLEYQRDLAASYSNLGVVYMDGRQWARALEYSTRAHETRKKLIETEPKNPANHFHLGQSNNNIAAIHYNNSRPGLALEYYREARDTFNKLVRDHPNDADFKRELALVDRNMGLLFCRGDQPAQSEKHLALARSALENLARLHPTVTQFQSDLASVFKEQIVLQKKIGRPELARRFARKSRDILMRLVLSNPAVPVFRRDLGDAQHYFGVMLHQAGKFPEALQALGEALKTRRQLVLDHPEHLRYRRDLATTLHNLGIAKTENRDAANATPYLNQARDIWKRLAAENPTRHDYEHSLAGCLHDLAIAMSKSGRRDEAVDTLRQAIRLDLTVAKHTRKGTTNNPSLKAHYRLLGRIYVELHKPDQAVEFALKWAELSPGVPAELYNVACELSLYATFLAKTKPKPAAKQQADGRRYVDEAVNMLRRAINAGYKDFESMKKDPRLVPIRKHPGYQQLIKGK